MQNEMRDRLVELIIQGDKRCGERDCRDCEHYGLHYCGFKCVADHLIENGVIVPPCKVGQTIYYLFQYSDTRILPFVRKAKIKKIYCGNSKMQFLIDGELKDAREKGVIKTWYFDDFGKTVFLTKEDAEQKLKEMRGDKK